MRIKVYKGTVSDGGDSLCETCRHATITRGRAVDEEIVRCDRDGEAVQQVLDAHALSTRATPRGVPSASAPGTRSRR